MEPRSRRQVLQAGVALAAGATALAVARDAVAATHRRSSDAAPLAPPPTTRRGDMLYRPLGRTGVSVSAIGLGGHHIGRPPSEDDGIRLIRRAIDAGITFMDNSWDYHDGGSEKRMGKALRDGYRDRVFLMTKIDGRTKKAAAQQIDESLRRLQTDRIDLLQHHEIIRMEDPDRIFAEAGAQEAVRDALQAGKIRFVGFTGHKDPAVHLRMLEVAAVHGVHLDTVQMPINVMDAHFRSFGHQVVPVALRQGVGVLGMKSMADGIILSSNTATPVECLHYALSQPTSVVITGIERDEILDQALTAVKTFTPMTGAQEAALLARTAQAAREGRFEPFKTAAQFDSTAKHPEWLG